MGCVWGQLKRRLFKSKSKGGDNSDKCDIENNGGENVENCDTNQAEVSPSESSDSFRKSLEDDSIDPFEEAINTCMRAAESLEHINKTRPKRSNIRRSTRKSKHLNIDLSDADKVKSRNNGDPNLVSGMKNSDELASKLSMLSQCIEEVTKPLSPTSTTPNVSNEFLNKSSESLSTAEQNRVQTQSETVIDRTKHIGKPLLNAAMFEELKRRQNRTNQSEISAKLNVENSLKYRNSNEWLKTDI